MKSPLILLFSSAVLISALQAADHFWDEIPLSPSTTRPAVVLDDYWNGEFQRVNREVAASQDTQLVFFGDSITWSWSLGPATGQEIWKNQFAPYNPINMGNSGDITPVMLHRLTRGNLDFPEGKHPKVAVMLCGINNFGVTKSAGGVEKWDLGTNCPPEQIAAGQRAIAQVFRRRLPHTRLIMVALLPVADKVKWENCQRVNAINAKLTLDPNQVALINLQDSFLLPGGNIDKSLFSDGIHLTKEGYQAWEKGIAPVMERFMKAPPLAPVKIMLIGGATTEGLDSNTSYRRYLDGILRRDGHLIDFVGSRKKHNDDKSEPDSYEFDPDHEGHSGKNSAWMAENLPNLLDKNCPDIAVIDLGAEDIAASDATAEALTNGIAQNMIRVIKELRSKNDQVRIVLVETLPVPGKEATSALLNQKIYQLTRASTSAQQPVVIAETNRNLERIQGANKAKNIAETLTKALQPLLAPHPDQSTKQ